MGEEHVFSQPIAFDLRTAKPNKTVDIGRDGTAVSLDACGRILQASTFHPEQGIIVAEPYEQFDGTKFYDSTYVRSYRKRMLQAIQDNKPGFGLNFGPNVDKISINIPRANVAIFAFSTEFSVVVRVEVLEGGDILQSAHVKNITSNTATSSCDTNLGVSLNRASYGQLTEGGPIPLPESHNIIQLGSHRSAIITNPALGAQLACISYKDDNDAEDVWPTGREEKHGGPLRTLISEKRQLGPQNTWVRELRFRLLPETKFHYVDATIFKDRTNGEVGPQWLHVDTITTYILRRNVDYILANCTIPVPSSDESSICILTDHVALPLGWNRDNYWQLRLLYSIHKHAAILLRPEHESDYTSRIHAVAKGHLTWAFTTAQRPHGYWHRSYLVTGKPKDGGVFQLDQQCYPLLELCDYLEYFPGEERFVKQILDLATVPQILSLLASKRDETTGLWPTDETPGDDAVLYPYHFSSHVLLWRTLTRLSDLYARLHSPSHPSVSSLSPLAASLRSCTLQHFTAINPESGVEMFAYLTDGAENHTFYHDANDIPTLFASSAHWSFVQSPAELETWHNTMTIALSPNNTQGYCNEGEYPGLGSVHSPGPWVLGYYQELAYAALPKEEWRMNEEGMKKAWRKIRRAMQWDGTFSEAVDPWTGECSSKAWFSWPGAMIGALLVELRREGLENILLG